MATSPANLSLLQQNKRPPDLRKLSIAVDTEPARPSAGRALTYDLGRGGKPSFRAFGFKAALTSPAGTPMAAPAKALAASSAHAREG